MMLKIANVCRGHEKDEEREQIRIYKKNKEEAFNPQQLDFQLTFCELFPQEQLNTHTDIQLYSMNTFEGIYHTDMIISYYVSIYDNNKVDCV